MSTSGVKLLFGMLALIMARLSSGVWAVLWTCVAMLNIALYWFDVWAERQAKKAKRR